MGAATETDLLDLWLDKHLCYLRNGFQGEFQELLSVPLEPS